MNSIHKSFFRVLGKDSNIRSYLMSLRVFHSDLIPIRSCIRPVDELFSNFGPFHRTRVRFCDDKISERSPILDQTRRIHRKDPQKSDEDEKLKKMYGPNPIPEFVFYKNMEQKST